MVKIDAALGEKANSSVAINTTLLASAWVGVDAPYTQTLTISGLTASQNGTISVAHNAQAKAWQETERKLSEKVNETENKPYKQIANNVNTVKVAIITCISTLLVSGIIGAIIAFGK